MGQNTSTAVMQRRSEPHDSLDDFPTPPWATRALCEYLAKYYVGDDKSVFLSDLTVREPAANRGYMAKPLAEYFKTVEASDVHDYGAGYAVSDFLFPTAIEHVDWTITNPPFRLAKQFIRRAMQTSREGVAVIVRSAFLEGVDRYVTLFSDNPPSRVLQFVERVPMVKGRYDPSASSATAYVWLVWMQGENECRLDWIAPCRKRLERVEDAA